MTQPELTLILQKQLTINCSYIQVALWVNFWGTIYQLSLLANIEPVRRDLQSPPWMSSGLSIRYGVANPVLSSAGLQIQQNTLNAVAARDDPTLWQRDNWYIVTKICP